MKIAIVDDDKKQQNALYKAVSAWTTENHQAANFFAYNSGEEFVKALDDKEFDIVFMDIYMEEMTGIDAAKILREHNLNTLLIFLTTSQDHMVQAFPCHAFDYLFKPFEEKRLYKTLNEALKVLPENSPYLDIVCDKHTHSVFLSEILYILSDSNYCIVGLKDNEYRTRASFSDFTSKVKDAPEFFTISRGIMVNLDNVISIDKPDCTLINQEVFPVSRRKHEEAEKALLERRFEKRRKGGSI